MGVRCQGTSNWLIYILSLKIMGVSILFQISHLFAGCWKMYDYLITHRQVFLAWGILLLPGNNAFVRINKKMTNYCNPSHTNLVSWFHSFVINGPTFVKFCCLIKTLHWTWNMEMITLRVEQLTQCGRDKMPAIFQTTFSKAFSWMKCMDFHWNFFEVCS